MFYVEDVYKWFQRPYVPEPPHGIVNGVNDDILIDRNYFDNYQTWSYVYRHTWSVFKTIYYCVP